MRGLNHLFQQGWIGGLTVANRVFFPAMITGLASFSGEVTCKMLAYYKARASARPGVVVVEIACVDAPSGKAALHQLHIDHPRFLPGLKALADVIKSWGSRAFIQLHHAGRQTTLLATEGQTPVAPSVVPEQRSRCNYREMDLDEIEALKARFVNAAGLALQAGFEGVEIHAGHGYLLGQFLSPNTNRRRDKYGGDAFGRARLVCEIVEKIRTAYRGLVVGVRFNVCDFVPGGLEPEEGLKIALFLEEAGVHYLSVTGGTHESGLTTVEPASFPEGWRIHLAAKVKKAVSVPVVGGGVIRHPEYAEEVLRQGLVDFVFVGRGQLADGEWLDKARQGQTERIRPCLSCNNCIAQSFYNLPIACTVNPYVGRETWLAKPFIVSRHKKIMVVGAGPAGMTAAVILARRGHRVTLVEAKSEVGGMLIPASRVPHKKRLGEFKKYLEEELRSAKVDVRVGQEVTWELLGELQPEAAVVATGSVPKCGPPVTASKNMVQALDVLTTGGNIKGKRVVVIGGGAVGCETALFLAIKGNRVIVLERGESLARTLNPMSRRDLLDGLKAAGVETVTGSVSIEVNEGRVAYRDTQDRAFDLEADLVVCAVGFEPYDPVSSMLKTLVPEVYVVGDAAKPRNIGAAVLEAATLARRL